MNYEWIVKEVKQRVLGEFDEAGNPKASLSMIIYSFHIEGSFWDCEIDFTYDWTVRDQQVE